MKSKVIATALGLMSIAVIFSSATLANASEVVSSQKENEKSVSLNHNVSLRAGTYIETTRSYTSSNYPTYLDYAYYDYTVGKTLSGTLFVKSVSRPTATIWQVVYSGYVS